MTSKFRLTSMVLIVTWLLANSVLPASAAKPINCGKPIVASKSLPMILNVTCSPGVPNLGVKSSLKSQSPRVMSFSKSPSATAMLNAVCSDLKLATDKYRTQINISMAVTYQMFALNLDEEDYYELLLILVADTKRSDFEINRCLNGVFIVNSDNGESEIQKAAQDLVKKNTALQDSCFFQRTSYGTNPTYARQLCTARFPNSLQWALSINHANEESCYSTRVAMGENEINARSICLARYPIR